jgi:hypothetical protein
MQRSWVRLLQWVETARQYPIVYQLDSPGPAVRNPVLEGLLPTMLYVRLASLFDDALDLVIDETGTPWPPKRKHDLYNRIELLAPRLRQKDQCHDLRRRRRELAHEAGASASWAELDAALDIVEGEFRGLGLVGPRPRYKAFAERSAARDGRLPNASFGFDYKFGLEEDDRIVTQYAWSSEVLRDSAE